jgi:hypothetical protein
MPGKRHPLGFAKSTETKVVRLGADTRKQCYISKVYKIPQNRGWYSPFFGSIFVELMRETEQVKAFIYVMILELFSRSLKYRYSDFLPER